MTHLDHKMYLNEDLMIIEKEYIDKETHRFIPIITDLYRKSLPLIRYRLDDILIEDNEGEKGAFTRIKQIEGRCDDIIYLQKENDTSLIPVYPDFLRRAIALSHDSIDDYLLEEQKDGGLKLTVETGDIQRSKKIESNILKSLKGIWKMLGTITPNIYIQFRDIPQSPYKKKKRIVSKKTQ